MRHRASERLPFVDVLPARADSELLRVHAIEEALLLRQACFGLLSARVALVELAWRTPDRAEWRSRARTETGWARRDGYEVSGCLLACTHDSPSRQPSARSLAEQALALHPSDEARFLLAAVDVSEGHTVDARAALEELLASDVSPAFADAVRELLGVARRQQERNVRS